MAHNSLIAVAETAEDVGAGLNKFLTPVADASAEIAALIAQCFTTSVALRKLDEAIELYEFERRYACIRADVAIVKGSLNYTFRDVQRLFGIGLARATILPAAAYRQVWRDLNAFFQNESNNTLERRLEIYQDFLKGLTCILTEGRPRRIDQFEDFKIKIERLLQAQEAASIVDEFDRTAIGPERPPSFERLRPRGNQARPLQPEPRRRPPRPRTPMEYGDYEDRYPRPRDPGRSPRPRSPLGYEYDPRPQDPGRRRPDRWHEDDGYYGRDPWVPLAPEVPGSPTDTFSSSSSGSHSVHEHWLPAVFNQGQPPSTLLTTTGQTSIFLGEDLHPDQRRQLSEEYDRLIEIPFESGDLAVRFYHRHADNKSRMLCRTLRPSRSRKESCLPLTALEVERSGPFLKFVKKRTYEHWAILKFPSYEKLVLFFCTFIALRAEDTSNPVASSRDSSLRHEEELFAGRIIDDHFEHALRVFRERECGGIRLEAVVLRGELKDTPVWTAFITHQVLSRRWMEKASSTVIHLADLQRYIFNSKYRPQTAVNGKHELTFVLSSDAREFRHTIRDLAEDEDLETS